MAKESKGGIMYSNPFNEVGGKDPNTPDVSGDDVYFGGWPEVMKMHLAETGDMVSSSNAAASHDVYGGPAPGEANPAGMSGKGGRK